MISWLAVCVGVMIGLGPSVATPPPADTIELQWHAPSSCPTETEVASRIAARLEPTARVPDRIVAEIVVALEHDTHVAELVVTTGSGRTIRRLAAPTCETVTEAAVLIVAMVHAQTQAAVPEPQPVAEQPVATPSAAPVPPHPSPTATKPVPPRERRWRGAAFAEIAVGFAGLPRVGPGLGGGVALVGRRVRAEVLGHFWFAREASIGLATDDARVDVRLWTLGVHAGPVLHAGPVEFALLVGGHSGLAHGEGDRVPITRAARRPWLALGAYPVVSWPLHSHVALGLRGTIEGVLVRPQFAVREGGARFTASRVTGALAAVVEVRFP